MSRWQQVRKFDGPHKWEDLESRSLRDDIAGWNSEHTGECAADTPARMFKTYGKVLDKLCVATGQHAQGLRKATLGLRLQNLEVAKTERFKRAAITLLPSKPR